MPLTIVARAVTQDEVLDLGDGGPVIGASGEVLLDMSDGERAYRFLMTGTDARTLGKALITEGWEAMKRKLGARGAIASFLKEGKTP